MLKKRNLSSWYGPVGFLYDNNEYNQKHTIHGINAV